MSHKKFAVMEPIHRLILLFLALLLFAPQASSAAQTQRVALVIGNSAYQTGPLANPVHDASDLAATLQRLGFTVILKKNASLQEMDESLRDFGDRLRRGGVGLFYYAGHGIQIAGRNYLVPVGARINRETDVKYQALDTEMVLDEMANAANDLNIVILDACRDNPFARSFRSASRGLAIISSAPKGTFISYSTSPGKVAVDGSGRNSPFTGSLIKHMTSPDVPIEEVFKRVRQDLVRRTKGQQIPWELSSLEGSFSFKPQKGAVPAAKAPDDLAEERRILAEERERIQREKELLEQKRALEEERKKLEQQRKDLEQSRLTVPKEPAGYGSVLFYDDFSSPKNGWPVYTNGPFYNTAFQDNRYVMETKNERKSLEMLALPPGATGDYDVELVSVWLRGITNNAYGLMLGQDRLNVYTFGVSANGQSVIWVNVNDIPMDDAMPWRPNTAPISDGRYVRNVQRVEVRGETLSYYVNNILISRIRSQFSLKSFGVCVTGQQAVAFLQVKITRR